MRVLVRSLVATVLAGAAVLTTAGCGLLGSDEADLQVYSARQYGSEEVFAEFTDETGISVDFIYDDNASLLERIKAEGESSPADVYMTVDAGNLWNAADQGVLASLDSETLDRAVPERDRDPDGRWYGLVKRARTVIYDPDAVDPAEFDAEDTYGGLTDPTWEGRLCMRDLSGAYQVSLLASLIDLHGEERAREIVEGWMANDVDIMANDVLLIEAVDAGTCDVAITNHYYLAREREENPELDVELYWASQEGAGTHVNLSGAGVVQTSDNPDQAQQLLEWLATDGQEAMIAGNHEYPVNPDVEPDEQAAAFGPFKEMPVDAAAYGSLNAEAAQIFADVGWQ
jgi:iron(III) transport system substrate-binding protein